MINWGQVDTALKQAHASKSPVYFYLFAFEGRISEALAVGLTPIEGWLLNLISFRHFYMY
jgi:hypothetical protein